MARLLMTEDDIARDKTSWLNIRRNGITASEIAAVLGIAPKAYGSPFALFTAKTTGEDWVPDKDEMVRGRHLEGYVADRFAAEHDYLQVMPGGLYAHPERPWQLATFDRLALDCERWGYPREVEFTDLREMAARHAYPVQIKTAISRDGWGDAYTADIPAHYRAQVMWEMDVQQAETAFVPCLFLPTWELVTYQIDRTPEVEEDLDFMRYEAQRFLDRLERDDPPEVDWTPATTDALKHLYQWMDPELDIPVTKKLARRYAAARRGKEQAEERLGKVANEIRQAIGPGRRAVITDADGRTRTVATRSRYDQGRIDVTRLRRERPDIAKEYETNSTVDKLSPGKWKG